ncbi:hypothetical protein [Streptomyces hainanensis]|uniref:Secreted protein n=1 Tax=Streptomyces hainanensis TaxID=402648 RepID=A0A4R4TFV3_9ACTN|nr:hypothetical protein [Streptomyces hainanensis]TDC76471.1 hypothetical protein E1283_09730 [Streptomyces hainanensis]
MRRVVTALVAVATAGITALTLATPAAAAHGELVFGGGQVVENPSGCVNASISPLILFNRTNEFALVYDGANCTRNVIAVVPPGGQTTREFGVSVFVA